MNCGDRRLIILVSAVIAVSVVALIAILAWKEKTIPTESWMVLTGIVGGLFGIFSHRQSAQQPQAPEEKHEEKV